MVRRPLDYQRKKSRNPYFSQKRQKKYLKPWLIIGGFFLIIFYFIFFSNWLTVKNIEIIGSANVDQQKIQTIARNQTNSKRWFLFSQNNILFFSKKSLANELAKDYFFQEVEIKKKYFQTIKITVSEKKSLIIWASGSDRYYLDSSGRTVRQMPANNVIIQSGGENGVDVIRQESDAVSYPLVYDQSNTPVGLNQVVAPVKLIDFIFNLNQALKEQSDFLVSHYNIVNANTTEVTVMTKEGWEIYFNSEIAISDQLALLTEALQQQITNRATLKYIDLRYQGKIYYQ